MLHRLLCRLGIHAWTYKLRADGLGSCDCTVCWEHFEMQLTDAVFDEYLAEAE